jgi:hypothetical protein
MSRIFLTGDIHRRVMGECAYGYYPGQRLGSDLWPEGQNLTEEDFLIFLGDFGILWNDFPDRRERDLLAVLEDRGCNILVLGGNHDNWTRLDNLPLVEKHGVTLGEIRDNIHFVPNGTVMEVGGLKFFFFGGAESIDKEWRKERMAKDPLCPDIYWIREIPTSEEFEFAKSELDKVDWNVDVVCTHTMPLESVKLFLVQEKQQLGKEKDPTAVMLQEFKRRLKYKKWYCGHFHIDKEYDGTRVLYREVMEVNI